MQTNIDGDDAALEFRVKDSYAEGGISALDTCMGMTADNNLGAGACMMNEWWASYRSSYSVGNTSQTSVSELTGDLQDWHTFKILTKDRNYYIYKDDILLKQVNNYAGDIGNLTKINFVTKGSGKIDFVKLYSKGQLVLEEGFDVDGKTTAVLKNTQLEPPTHLIQEIQSPYMDKEEIAVGTKVGKFQSGSGIILSADMYSSIFDFSKKELEVEVYRVGETIPIYDDSSSDGQLIVPFAGIGAGGYYWRARVKDEDGNISDWVEYGNNKADFSFYDTFEPYPYGYSFENGSPEKGLLTGGTKGYFTGNRTKIEGERWEIFNKVFPENMFQTKELMFDTFENIEMENDKIFSGGTCFGLGLSSALKYSNPLYMMTEYSDFYNKIGSGYIWDNIEKPVTSMSFTGGWNNYNETLKTILSLHIVQKTRNFQEAKEKSLKNLKPLNVLDILKNNPDKTYILGFFGYQDGIRYGHAVIPYKVEGSKIYIWDNNFPLSKDGNNNNQSLNPYKQYMEIIDNNNWNAHTYKTDYNWKNFEDLILIDLKDIFSTHLDLPGGFNGTDTLYTFSGDSDIIITDSLGRKTGFENGQDIEEIPGISIITPFNFNINGSTSNKSKQIYLPQKIDGLTIKVLGKTDENYNLMVAGGDYYTKISGVNTSSGQIDSYTSTNSGVSIDFDNAKTGNYTFLTDNFVNTQTGTIFLSGVTITPESQKYSFDWNKVQTNANDSIIYQVDSDNDGNFDITSNFSAVPKIMNEKGSISGYVKSTPSNAGWKVCLDTNNNGICEENKEPFQVTNNTGYYEFANLEKGVYNIIEIPKNNWEIITPKSKKYTLNLNNGQNFKNINFENKKVNGK